jgi:hypothetical protein
VAHKQSLYYHTYTPTCPQKTYRKKPILLAFTAKQKYSLCSGIAFYSSIRSKASSQVPFSSIFYNSNAGIGIPITTTTNPGADFRTKEPYQQCLQMPYSTFDFSSGRAAYVGKEGEEEMMEDTVEASKFFTNLSCLDDNIDKIKN